MQKMWKNKICIYLEKEYFWGLISNLKQTTMKRIFLSLCICFFYFSSSATHLMGGQMTSRNIGGLTYEVTLTAYRDTLGIPMYLQATINYSDTNGFTATHIVPVSTPVQYGNGVEEYKYIDTITFPASGEFTMWWEDCCRNCALLNMTNPCGEYFHLYNVLWADSTNSSPVFLNPPIPIAQENVAFNYNPLPFDADGDSIAWQLDIPVSAAGVYVVGYSLPPSDTSMPFTMNQLTGEVSFLPNTLGHFEVSVLVSEFRNGVKIGEIRRDMQIIVVPSKNKPCNFSSASNTFPYSGKQYDLVPGSAFSLTVTSTETDNNPVNLVAAGEPFILSGNPATSTVNKGNGQATATISWTPNSSQLRSRPYIFALRNIELFGPNTFSTDISFSLRVGNGTTGITGDKEADAFVSVYPNPNDGNCYVELNITRSGRINISIASLTGQTVSRKSDVQVNAGKNIVYLSSLNLNAGSYFVTVENNGNLLGTQKLEIR